MLSCKNCGAQMSGIDLVCKSCGTPWGKKHKSRTGIYFSILILVIVGGISYIYFTPGSKDGFMKFYNNVFATIPNNEENKEQKNEDLPPADNNVPGENEVTPPINNEPEVTPPPVEEIPKEPEPPVFTWVSASSSLKGYGTELTTDGKLETAWLEGVKGNGIGEWLMYSAEADQTVSSITIYNGYLKNDKVYINNGRIKKFSLEFSDGEIITYDVTKTNFSNAKNGYTINFETPKVTSSVKLTILDAFQGAYYTDTGISGITFN